MIISEYLRQQAGRHNVTVDALVGPARHRVYCRARAAIAKDLRARGWSYPRIGRLLGRDHSTVINLLRRYA